MSGLRPPAGTIGSAPARPPARGRALASLCGIILALAGAAARSALAGEGAPQLGGISAVPATFNAGEPITRSYFRPRIAAGGTAHEEALLRNSSAHTVSILVYPVEGLTGVTSGAVYSSRGSAMHGPGRWVTPALARVTLAPGSARRVAFTVRVPRGTQPGDHLAGIAFQNANPSRSGGRFSITQILRIVIGVEVIVPGPAAAQIQVEGASLGPLGGTQRAAVIVALRNGGRLLCRPELAVTLHGAQGATRTVSRRLEAILPGDAIPYPLPWPEPLAPGAYTIAAQASDCGQAATISAAASLGQPLAGSSSAAPTARRRTSLPWALLAGACAAAALLSLLLLLFVRRRERRRSEPVAYGHGQRL